MSTAQQYDLTYEIGFDGDLGSLISIDAQGHLEPSDVELFVADVVREELDSAGYDTCPAFGLEVEHLWRSFHPLDLDHDEIEASGYADRWAYQYTSHERDGTEAITRFQVASPWSREAIGPNSDRAVRDRRTGEHTIAGVDSWPVLCVHHPDEPAVTGIPEQRFSSTKPGQVIDGHVYYCLPCSQAFNQRMEAATEKAMATFRVESFLDACEDDVIAQEPSTSLHRSDLLSVLHGDDATGAARWRIAAFANAYRAYRTLESTPVAIAHRGNSVLKLSDIHHLVEGYTHRSA